MEVLDIELEEGVWNLDDRVGVRISGWISIFVSDGVKSPTCLDKILRIHRLNTLMGFRCGYLLVRLEILFLLYQLDMFF